MLDTYIGTISLFATPELPRGWLPCDGRTLSYKDHQALFAIIGVQFGGDFAGGQFKLPDLRGRIPMGIGYGDEYREAGTTNTLESQSTEKQPVGTATFGICVEGVFPPRPQK